MWIVWLVALVVVGFLVLSWVLKTLFTLVWLAVLVVVFVAVLGMYRRSRR